MTDTTMEKLDNEPLLNKHPTESQRARAGDSLQRVTKKPVWLTLSRGFLLGDVPTEVLHIALLLWRREYGSAGAGFKGMQPTRPPPRLDYAYHVASRICEKTNFM